MNTLKNHSKQLTWLMGLLLTGFIAGCGSDGGGTTQPGTASVSMTDAPACGFEAVNVTVSKVRVHQSESATDTAAGWTDITVNPPRKINLLDLNDPTQPNFALESLGETPLEAGHYTQLRLVLDRNTGQSLANSVVLENTTSEIALVTPSAVQSGIKLIHQFDVGSGQRVDLLLDFDACKSIVKTGNGKYILKPVIKVIPFVLNGIEGFVDKTLPNVSVSAQVNGDIVRATVLNTVTGKFFLAHLPAGTGVKYDVVITADDHATAVISGVPVPTTTSITAVSTSGAPIPVVTPPTLEASATHSISGTVTLNPAIDDETVIVAAKQALNGGPTVTVKSAVATVMDAALPIGDYGYNLTLPIDAPSLGPYATPLPIVFTKQPASVAGQYTIQVSATGYVTKSSLAPVDISGGDAPSQDFTLMP
ncbi:MAG: DUF4382 domain-containing protein [Nitrospiraceae bacterium]